MIRSNINFLIGGKLGDFIHALFAVRGLSDKLNCKVNVYMVDIGWDFGIENTFRELKPILLNQDYINSFEILKDYYLDPIQTPNKNSPIEVYDKDLLEQGYYCAGDYLNSSLLYKNCWSEIFSDLFNFKIKEKYKWIDYDFINHNTLDKVVIHRKFNDFINKEFPYEEIIYNYGKENCVFISSNEHDYEVFPLKHLIPFYKIHTLHDWFSSINSASMVVSNLTGPAAIAHSLDKPRIIELTNRIDSFHCIGEDKYSKNLFYFINKNINNLK